MGDAVNPKSTRFAVQVLDVERIACPLCAPDRGLCQPLRHDLGDLVAAIISERRDQAVAA